MTQLKTHPGERAPEPVGQWHAVTTFSVPHEPARVLSLLSRICDTDTPSKELAYGCVDWYLYGTDALAPISH